MYNCRKADVCIALERETVGANVMAEILTRCCFHLVLVNVEV
jgi:hypothetical protein